MQTPNRSKARIASVTAVGAVAISLVLTGPASPAQAVDPPWMDTSLSSDERAALLVEAMTLEEKVDLMTDDPAPAGQELAYYNAGIERLGIPELRMADIGPGVRFSQSPTTAFPYGIAAAASWNLDAIEQVGDAVREEARNKRFNMVLGPNVDLPRNPWWSRIAETFGEDPLLSGRMGAGFVEAAQAQHDMMVSLKHYNVYGAEVNRVATDDLQQNVILDERTLQEVYTRPWAPPVAKDLASVMCSFNKVNGVQACENEHLIEDILRDQLGFDGFVLTDFGATRPRTEATIEGGTNMETGVVQAYGPALLAAVQNGTVSEELVDLRVLQILRTYFEFGVFDNPLPDTIQPVAEEEHNALARTVAEQAITLLKNDGALPLAGDAAPGSIAVVGQGARWMAQQCCAGAVTNPTVEVTPLEGITNIAPAGVSVESARGTDAPDPSDLIQGPDAVPSSVLSVPGSDERGVQAEYYDNTDFSGEPLETRTNLKAAFDNGLIAFFWQHPETVAPPAGSTAVRFTGELTAPATGDYQLSLSGFGTGSLVFDGQEIVSFEDQRALGAYVSDPITLQEGQSYPFTIEYAATNPRDILDPGMVRLGWVPPEGVVSPDIEEAVQLASESDVAIVVAGIHETEARDRGELDLSTEQDELIEAVAAANPRTIVVLQGGGGVLMPWLDDVEGVVQTYYTGGEQGNALADILFGNVNPSGKLPVTYAATETQATEALGVENTLLNSEESDIVVTEGINIGYRGYAEAGAEPLFPFGHGLSYTSYEYADMAAEAANGTVNVSFTLTNTGDRAGAEVAQVYAGTLPTAVETPVQQLAGFGRIDLAAGESRRVTVQLACKSLAYWDEAQSQWVSPAGDVNLTVGASSRDIRLEGSVTLPGGVCSEDSDLAMNATSTPIEEPLPPVVNEKAPKIVGSAKVGHTVRVNAGHWSVDDATLTYQWLRDGEPIQGATGDRYTLTAEDAGRQITVVVTASAEGFSPGTAESEPVAVGKTASSVSISADPSSVKVGESTTVTVDVDGQGVEPTGLVEVREGARVVASGTLEAGDGGVLTLEVTIDKKGATALHAVYAGDDRVDGSSSQKPAKVTAR